MKGKEGKQKKQPKGAQSGVFDTLPLPTRLGLHYRDLCLNMHECWSPTTLKAPPASSVHVHVCLSLSHPGLPG